MIKELQFYNPNTEKIETEPAISYDKTTGRIITRNFCGYIDSTGRRRMVNNLYFDGGCGDISLIDQRFFWEELN